MCELKSSQVITFKGTPFVICFFWTSFSHFSKSVKEPKDLGGHPPVPISWYFMVMVLPASSNFFSNWSNSLLIWGPSHSGTLDLKWQDVVNLWNGFRSPPEVTVYLGYPRDSGTNKFSHVFPFFLWQCLDSMLLIQSDGGQIREQKHRWHYL